MAITVTSMRGATPWTTCHTLADAERESVRACRQGLNGEIIPYLSTYTVRTDACEQDIDAETMDAAAVEYASSEGIRGVTDVDSLLAAIRRIDGAWLWIEPKGDSGKRRGSHMAGR